MDFSPDEGQQAVADVVTSALGRDNSWQALVDGGVIAFGVPERLGGDGLELPEIATALTEIGRHGTVSPALATLGLGLVPLLDLALRRAAGPLPGRGGEGWRADRRAQRAWLRLAGSPGDDPLGWQALGHQGRRSLCRTSGLDRRHDRQRGRGGVADGGRCHADVKTPTANGSDEYVVTFDDVAVPDSDVLGRR